MDAETGEPCWKEVGELYYFNRAMIAWSRQAGKQMAAAAEEVNRKFRGLTIQQGVVDEFSKSSAGTRNAGSTFDFRISDDPNRTPVQIKNDGLTFKKPKQTEPWYVKATKRSRR